MNDESDESRIKETIQKSKTRLNEDNRTKLNELEIFKKVPFEFKDGWTDLIYELGKDIEDLCKLANCELPLIQQIKEKFGTLRFYYNTLNLQYPPIVEKSIRALVTVAEIKSAEICEYCGKYGELRVSKRGLYFTVCDEHKEDSLTSKEYEEFVLKKTPQNRQKAI